MTFTAERDLLANGARRQLGARHQHERLEAADAVAGIVRVDRGQRAVVTGVHRLEHVESFAAAALTDDDAVRPHAQRVDDQVSDRHSAAPFDVRPAGSRG